MFLISQTDSSVPLFGVNTPDTSTGYIVSSLTSKLSPTPSPSLSEDSNGFSGKAS